MSQELIFKETNIAAYDEFRSQLTALQVGNEKAVFDYRDPKGNKEARSHVYKLRQTKAAIEKVRKQEKEVYLLKGRQVDSEAKEISAVVEQMIEVHETPLKEIEREEELRIETHKNAICAIIDIGNGMIGGQAQPFGLLFEELKLIVIDEKFQEFEAEAHRAKNEATEKLSAAFAEHQKREAEQAELARLRQEAAEREQKEREDRIAREAAEQARIAAEKAAEAERRRLQDEADRQTREAQFAVERAQREKAESEAAALRQKQEAEQAAKEALERAEREKQAAIEAERKRIADEQAALIAEAEQREKNKAHAKKINNEILEDIIAAGCTEECGKKIIAAIARGQVRHTKINY